MTNNSTGCLTGELANVEDIESRAVVKGHRWWVPVLRRIGNRVALRGKIVYISGQ